MGAWVDDGQLTSAAFRTGDPASPRYASVSLFVEERLDGQDGEVLHVGRFAAHGRARLAVRHIRSAGRASGGTEERMGFDLLMTGTADPPLDAFDAAHAELQGPTRGRAAARALAVAFNRHGRLERAPG